MNKSWKLGVAALTLAAVTAGAVLPAEAQPRRGYDRYDRRHDRRDNDAGVAIVAGVIGLALGAAIAGDNNNDRYRYNNGYRSNYDTGYGYGYDSYYGRDPYYGRRVCERDTRTWDRYGRPVIVRQQYAC